MDILAVRDAQEPRYRGLKFVSFSRPEKADCFGISSLLTLQSVNDADVLILLDLNLCVESIARG